MLGTSEIVAKYFTFKAKKKILFVSCNSLKKIY